MEQDRHDVFGNSTGKVIHTKDTKLFQTNIEGQGMETRSRGASAPGHKNFVVILRISGFKTRYLVAGIQRALPRERKLIHPSSLLRGQWR
jgi:hypothetical protein